MSLLVQQSRTIHSSFFYALDLLSEFRRSLRTVQQFANWPRFASRLVGSFSSHFQSASLRQQQQIRSPVHLKSHWSGEAHWPDFWSLGIHSRPNSLNQWVHQSPMNWNGWELESSHGLVGFHQLHTHWSCPLSRRRDWPFGISLLPRLYQCFPTSAEDWDTSLQYSLHQTFAAGIEFQL